MDAIAAVAPSGTDKSVALPTSTSPYTFITADWGFSDTDAPANAFAGIKITTLPANGVLKADGVNITAGQTVAAVGSPAGTTWSPATGLSNLDGLSSAVSQDGSKMVEGIWAEGIRVSSNSGATWASVLPGTTPTRIAMSADGTKIFAGMRGDKIYVSTDSGTTWTGRDSSRFWAGLGCSSDGTYAVAGDDFGVFVSSNGGVTWTQRISTSHWWPGAGASADGSKMVACGDTEIRTSTDFGVTWTTRRNDSGLSYISAASSGDGTRLFVVPAGGQIKVSTDGGANWTLRGSSLNWVSVACSADGLTALATDGANAYVSTDGGTTWTLRQAAAGSRGVSVSGDGRKMLLPAGNPIRAIPLYVSTGSVAPVITYTPPGGGLTGTAGFTFQVQDDGTANTLDLSPNTFTFLAPATIALEGNATGIANQDATPSLLDHSDFGSTATAGGSVTRTFTVRNIGGVSLSLTGTPKVVVSGANAADFTVTAQPASPVAAAGSTTFQVAFDPSANGVRTATLSLASGDTAQNPFTFAIQGTGLNTAPSGIALSASILAENGPANTTVGTLTASDLDVGDTHTFTLVAGAGSTDNASFNISGNALRLTGSADFEVQSSYSVRVQAADGNGGTSATAFTITVSNIPDAPAGTDKSIALATATSTYTLTSADWGFSDSDVPANAFTGVQVTTLPASGLLKSNGVNITAGQTVSMVGGPAGTTWSAATGLSTLDGLSSGLSQDGSKIVAGFWGGGLRVSSNGGSTWTSALPGTTPARIAMSADGTKVYASLRSDKIFVSSDSGATWTGREASRNWTALACSADGTYAAAGDDFGIYVTSDGGVTWTPRISNAHWWAGAGASADGSKMVVCGDTEIRTSTDFGVTWTVRRTEAGIAHTAAASSADGTRLFVVQSTGKILVSTDSGATWTPRGNTATWGAVSCSSDGMTVLANEGSNSYVSTDGGTNWVLRHTAPGGRGVSVSGNGRKMLVPSGGAIRATPLFVSTGPAAPVITYTPPAGGLTGTASFTFQVQDDGVSNNLDLSPNTLTFLAPGAMVIEGNSTAIANRDSTPSLTDHSNFGSTPTVGGSITRTFTIRNNGGVLLNLTGTPKVSVGGTHASDFTVVTQPSSPVAGSGGSTTFQVTFDPSASGVRTATLSIANDDTAQNPFTFAILGTGENSAPVAVNDSANRPNNIRVVKVLKSVLLANDTDVDLDALSITAAANALPVGATVAVSGSFVIYTAPANNSGNGSFDYTLSDGAGGHTVTGSVIVTEVAVVPPNPPPNAANVAVVPNGPGNDVVLTFLVATGRQYRVQYAVGGAPFTWQEFSPQAVYTPASNGVITHVDQNPVDPVRAYRIVLHP